MFKYIVKFEYQVGSITDQVVVEAETESEARFKAEALFDEEEFWEDTLPDGANYVSDEVRIRRVRQIENKA